MIVRTICTKCLQPYQLVLQPDEAVLVKQVAVFDHGRAQCPRMCGGFINVLGIGPQIVAPNDVQLKEPINLTGKQLYQAINGMGLPDEIPKNSEVIQALLAAKQLDTYAVEEVDGRVYIHELRLEGGTTIHLTAGPRGAMVLKVTTENLNGAQDHR